MKLYKGTYPPKEIVEARTAYLNATDPLEKARLKRLWRGLKRKEEDERMKRRTT